MIPTALAMDLMNRAALALQRAHHEPGVALSVRLKSESLTTNLSWETVNTDELLQHDRLKVTEDGAEAVSLALAGQLKGWAVLRRLQIGEHGDWLLQDSAGPDAKTVALEISGVESGPINKRLKEKLAQVAQTQDVDERWAGVVGFEAPASALQFTRRRRVQR